MSESVFEKLLGSYSGMRKRTWAPSMIEEAAGPDWWAREFSLGDEIDPQTKVSQYQQAKANIQKASSEQGTVTPQQASQQLTTYGQAVATTKGVQVLNRVGQAPRGIKRETVPTVIQALDLLIQKAGTEKSKKPDPEKSDKDLEKDREGLAPVERAEFSPSEREDISRTIERALGLDPTQSMKLISDLENTINQPRKGTKVSNFLSILDEEQPELVEKAKGELKNGVGALFSVMGKIQKDSNGRSYINASDLTSTERDALKVLTIRNNGNIFIGRPGESVEAFKTLQQNATLGDANYGYTLGKSLSQFSPLIRDLRIVDSSMDVDGISDDEFKNLPKGFQGSKSGTGSASNDAVGKFKEYVTELSWAMNSGDKKAINEARQKLKDGLEKFGSIPNDLQALETPLDDVEFDMLESLREEADRSGGLDVFVKNMIRDSVGSVDKFNNSLGIKSGDVVKIGTPSQSSVMGERPDVIAFIKPEASLNQNALGPGTKLHVVTEDDEDLIAEYGEDIIGTTMVNTSIKVKKEESATVRAGTGAIAKMLGAESQEYDELRAKTMDRLVSQGVITEEQKKVADKALDRDRAIYRTIEDKLSRLNPKNKNDVISFLRKMDIDDVTISGREKYQNEAKEIAQGLASDDPEVKRLARVRVFQLYKIRKSATSGAGNEYARGSMFNDAVLSFASQREEPISIQSPTRNSVSTNHNIMAKFAQSVFDPQNNVRVDPARSNISTPDGKTLFGLRRVARKGKNPAIEFEINQSAEKEFMQTT